MMTMMTMMIITLRHANTDKTTTFFHHNQREEMDANMMIMRETFLQHFEPAGDSRVRVADVRRVLGSAESSESSGRNFRPWLSRILGDGFQVITQTIGGCAWLLNYKSRMQQQMHSNGGAVSSQDAPPPLPQVQEVVSVEASNRILEAIKQLTLEQAGPIAPQLVEAASVIQTSLQQVHAQAVSLRETVVQLAATYTSWAEEPTRFLQHLIGTREDVFVRPDYKPFFTLEPSGRRKFCTRVPSNP